jgi:hypothetical protein
MKIPKSRWILSLLVVIFAINIPTFADGDEPEVSNSNGNYEIVTTFFTNITLFQNVFDILTDGKASISVYLTARNVDHVKIDSSLQQFKNGNWLTIKSWTNTSAGTYVGVSGSYYVPKGYQYRMISSGFVYKSGNLIEQTDFYSIIKTY